MLPLDAQALTRVHAPEAFLEPVAEFVRPRREGGCTPRLHGHEGSPFGISAPVMLKHRASIACQNFVKYGKRTAEAPHPRRGFFFYQAMISLDQKALIP